MNFYPYSVEQTLPDGSRILVARNQAISKRHAIKAAQLPENGSYTAIIKYVDGRMVVDPVKVTRFAVAVVTSIMATNEEEAYRLVERSLKGREISVEYSTNAFPVPASHSTEETEWWIPEVLWGGGNINLLNGESISRTNHI